MLGYYSLSVEGSVGKGQGVAGVPVATLGLPLQMSKRILLNVRHGKLNLLSFQRAAIQSLKIKLEGITTHSTP